MVNDINKGDFALDLKLVAEFINVMLRKWAEELNERDEMTKMSVKGKIEAGVYAQTRYKKMADLIDFGLFKKKYVHCPEPQSIGL